MYMHIIEFSWWPLNSLRSSCSAWPIRRLISGGVLVNAIRLCNKLRDHNFSILHVEESIMLMLDHSENQCYACKELQIWSGWVYKLRCTCHVLLYCVIQQMFCFQLFQVLMRFLLFFPDFHVFPSTSWNLEGPSSDQSVIDKKSGGIGWKVWFRVVRGFTL